VIHFQFLHLLLDLLDTHILLPWIIS